LPLWHIRQRGFHPLPKPALGSTVGGKYRILRALGEGGMGTVYEVEHVLTHKRAAIKRVHPQTGSSDSAHDRLLHEARASSRIHHRNVVDVYDVLREEDAVCLVMQLLVGEPLSERIAKGPMPLHEFVALLVPAMRGVAAAHAAGVIHRDIKPDNIFLAREPGQAETVPKVIDFGISKVFDPDSPNHLTRSGVTMGTPKYVSYEQLLGARDVDGRADVYAFGVMLYEAITGEPPYRAGTFGEQAVAFAMSVPPRPSLLQPLVPPSLDRLVYRAIAKDREQRIGSMAELISELEVFADPAACSEPLSAFVKPAQRSNTGARHNDPTRSEHRTPASRRREELPEISRLSPTPMAPAPQSSRTREGALSGSHPDGRDRAPRTGLMLVGIALCALALLGWRLLLTEKPAASLAAAHAAPSVVGASLASPVPQVVPQAPSDSLPIHEESNTTPAQPGLQPTAGSANLATKAPPATQPRRALVATPDAGGVRDNASTSGVQGEDPSRRTVAAAPGAIEAAAREPRTEPALAADPGVPGEQQPATHRAGPLARDEF
jgi:serine/threonine protein kinase